LTAGIGALADKTYGPLFDQLNLSPEQRVRVKGLILGKTMVGAPGTAPDKPKNGCDAAGGTNGTNKNRNGHARGAIA
jgi:hypothetical protein